MEQLKTRLNDERVRGVVRSADGQIVEFHRKGVVDLFCLLAQQPDMLRDAQFADRVIGRGAALLLVKGGVREVYAHVMSQPALQVLRDARIPASCATLQPHIVNRSGDGICPVEQLTATTRSPHEAYQLIHQFLLDKSLIPNSF